jgi:hypothetical protein
MELWTSQADCPLISKPIPYATSNEYQNGTELAERDKCLSEYWTIGELMISTKIS